ncbi:hypothetical protein SCHPADRAFT_825871 [Schizopora paradoxa]|uniref:Carbohydrate esterase family 16 protein n=1 Tax=Schizopora paradoxa TaxID=27342 RepID=A0A0H2RSY0_9AGAM|nr:hypothetical protein SCHPADRAFT_825871 [Schizopora paradoxa]
MADTEEVRNPSASQSTDDSVKDASSQQTIVETSKSNNWQRVSASWAGYDALRYLFVFGASYCQVGYYSARSPQPTPEQPLGVEFPGDTYNEPGEPNWVGFLARDFKPRDEGVEKPLLVYDYAVGGQMVHGVKHQVQGSFLPHVGEKPEWSPWTESDSLFSIWIGINDTAFGCQAKETIEKLYEVLQTLFDAGARNFLLIDVPPMHRSPALQKTFTDGPKSPKPYTTWNNELRSQGNTFATTNPEASLFIFSSYDLFESILDDPERFGFVPEDTKKRGGAIWFDHIHPTTKMHKLIAEDIVSYLRSISKTSSRLESDAIEESQVFTT